MGHKIDGLALAAEHTAKLKAHLKGHPTIVSFCNQEDEPSVRYTEMKAQKAAEVGIIFKKEMYDTSTSQEELADKIRHYNEDPQVNGIMVQLPVPLDLVVFQQDLLNLIKPEKDVDGLTVAGQKIYMPATVKSVISILEAEVPGWEQQRIAVVGCEGEIGKPLTETLKSRGIDPICIDLNQGNLNQDLQDADIVISTTGKEHLIKADMVKDGVVAIDVGLGDLDPAVYDKASKYTARTGGVGPMTVVSLMENVVKSFHGTDGLNETAWRS